MLYGDISSRLGEDYTIHEDFDNGLTKYSGDTALFSVVQSPTITGGGSNVLEMASNDYYCHIYATGESVLGPGTTFDVFMRTSSGGTDQQGEFKFGLQDTSNYYRLRPYFDDDAVYMQVNDGGSNSTFIFDDQMTFSTGAWYRFRVDWEDDNTFTLSTFDAGGTTDPSDDTKLSESSGSETTFTSAGGWGWGLHNTSGAPIYYDVFREVV